MTIPRVSFAARARRLRAGTVRGCLLVLVTAVSVTQASASRLAVDARAGTDDAPAHARREDPKPAPRDTSSPDDRRTVMAQSGPAQKETARNRAAQMERSQNGAAEEGTTRAGGATGKGPTVQDAPRVSGTPLSRSVLHDPRAQAALERGLAWLSKAQAQETDGSFPALGLAARGPNASPATDGSGQFAPVAITALGALAFLAGGSEPDRGPHGREAGLAIDWLVARANLDAQSARHGYLTLASDSLSRMHGHGFAALALAEAYVMSPKTERGARVATALQAAVECIEKSQGVEGGWYYDPKSGLQHENSITICAVQALRAARHSGASVDPKTIARAVDYVARTQKPDGSFRYALGDEKSSVALTAAAISTLNATGTYSGRVIEDGYDWILRRLATRAAATGSATEPDDFVVCPFYERLYLSQALWQHSDPRVFEGWWREELPRVLVSQTKDGAWSDPRYGDCYATAMNCLFLALPEGLLPIFQR